MWILGGRNNLVPFIGFSRIGTQIRNLIFLYKSVWRLGWMDRASVRAYRVQASAKHGVMHIREEKEK